MRVLPVEDDPEIASFVLKYLKESGFVADHVLDRRGETSSGADRVL